MNMNKRPVRRKLVEDFAGLPKRTSHPAGGIHSPALWRDARI